jgi:membrane protease YdiL (CAAX protease family)
MFLALVFGLGWPVLAVPVLADHALIPGGSLPVEPFALAVTLFVMLPAALWVTAASEGRSAVSHLLSRAFRWRFGLLWWALVLLALPVTTLALGVAVGGSLHTAGAAASLLAGGVSVLIALLVIHLWEETVWAGFLQTRLEHRYSLVVAALLTALPFAAIHLPLQLIGDITARSLLVDLAGLLFLAVALRLMIGVFQRGAADSLLAVGILHAVFNASNNHGGLVDSLLNGANQNIVGPVAMVVVTAVTAMCIRDRLGRSFSPEN